MKTLPDSHDLEHLNGALKHIPPERRRVAVDAGAHRGIWTRRLAECFELVWAFEPSEGLFQQIPVEPNVIKVPLALGGGEMLGWFGMEKGPDNDGQGHLVEGNDVLAVPLDNYAPPEISPEWDLLKLDVEGCEWYALQGAEHIIDTYRPWVMLEINHLSETYYNVHRNAAQDWLLDRGYSHADSWNKDHLFRP